MDDSVAGHPFAPDLHIEEPNSPPSRPDKNPAPFDFDASGRFCLLPSLTSSGVPHQIPSEPGSVRQPAEGAGIRIRDRADQVVDPRGRPVPIDAAVLRSTAAEVTPQRDILRDAGRAPDFHQGQEFIQQDSRRVAELPVQGECGIVPGNGHDPLPDDIPRIGLPDHVMEGDAGPHLSVHENPVDGTSSAIGGQERSVEVIRPFRRNSEDLLPDHMAVIERKDHLRMKIRDPLLPFIAPDIGGTLHGDAPLPSPFFHRAEPAVFSRIILMGKNADNLISGAFEGVEKICPKNRTAAN